MWLFRKISHKRTEFFLIIFFILSFRTFQYFPTMFWLREFWIVVIAISSFFVLTLYRWLTRGLRYTSYEIYILVVMGMSIYSSLMAKDVFQQPVYYGFFSHRDLFLSGSSLILIFLWERNVVRLKEIENALVSAGWFCLFVFSFMFLFLDPADFSGYQGFVVGNPVSGYEFHFVNTFIVFSCLYYIIKSAILKDRNALLFALPFLFFLLLDGERSLIVSIFITILLAIWQFLPPARLTIWLVNTITFVSTSLVAFYLFFNELFLVTFSRFSSAFKVILLGEMTTDISANARLFEIALAWPYIKKNWLMGNGNLSYQWNGGYQEIIGYFFPTDIGLLGVIYIYGVVGLSVFLFQVYYISKFARKISVKENEILSYVSVFFLVYFFIHSLVTGAFVHYLEVSLGFITFLYLNAMKEAPSDRSGDSRRLMPNN